MGYIETRKGKNGSTSFRAQVRMKGHAPVSETFIRKSDANQWIQATESKMREGEYLPVNEAKKHLLAEAIDRYIADKLIDSRKHAQPIAKLKWFRHEIGFKRLSDVTPAIIANCRLKLKSEKVRNKFRTGPTTNRYMSALSAVFEYSKDTLYWCNKNPVREVKWERENDGIVRFLSDDEKKRLLETCEKDHEKLIFPLVVLALSTGMRKEEIRGLCWRDVDLEKGAILLGKDRTKNRTARRVPLRGKALELLKKLKDDQNKNKIVKLNPFVFPNPSGDDRFDLRATWDRVRKSAALDNFRFHDLRHSCASYLAMNGASSLEIAEILGHKTLAMVKRYAHLADSHTSSVVEKMNTVIFSIN